MGIKIYFQWKTKDSGDCVSQVKELEVLCVFMLMILSNGFQKLQDIDTILLSKERLQIKSGVSQLRSKHLQIHKTSSILQGILSLDFTIKLVHGCSVNSSSFCSTNTSISEGSFGSKIILKHIFQTFHSSTHFKKIDGSAKQVNVKISLDLSREETSLGKDHLGFRINSSIQVR